MKINTKYIIKKINLIFYSKFRAILSKTKQKKFQQKHEKTKDEFRVLRKKTLFVGKNKKIVFQRINISLLQDLLF